MSYYSFLDCVLLYVDVLYAVHLTAVHLMAVYMKELYMGSVQIILIVLNTHNTWSTSLNFLVLSLREGLKKE